MESIRKTLYLILACCSILVAGTTSAQAQNSADDKFVVVIDPGHGGNQPGATYGGVEEKDINLAIALKFGGLITQNMPGVKVLYTRTTDKNVSLAARGDMANKAHADLFVSIHINAHDNTAAAGTSTWVMGVEKNDANLAEAMRENEVIRYEDDSSQSYAGFDPSSPESYVIFQLMQSAHFERSIQFARIIQRHFATGTTMKDRGAEQGPFLVLWKATMPAVLTEVGFLSNPSDRAYIASTRGQDDAALSLYDAFREYVNLVGRTEEDDTSKGSITVKTVSSGGSRTSSASAVPAFTSTASDVSVPVSRVVVSSASSSHVRSSGEIYSSGSRSSSSERSFSSYHTDRPMRNNDYYTASASGTLRPGYYVQLLATSAPVSVNDARFGPYSGKVKERFVDGLYKYMIGPYQSSDQAAWVKGDVRAKGFYDAFIVKL